MNIFQGPGTWEVFRLCPVISEDSGSSAQHHSGACGEARCARSGKHLETNFRGFRTQYTDLLVSHALPTLLWFFDTSSPLSQHAHYLTVYHVFVCVLWSHRYIMAFPHTFPSSPILLWSHLNSVFSHDILIFPSVYFCKVKISYKNPSENSVRIGKTESFPDILDSVRISSNQLLLRPSLTTELNCEYTRISESVARIVDSFAGCPII